MNNGSVAMIDRNRAFFYGCIVREALKADLIFVVKKTERVDLSAWQVFAQIMILAEILPGFATDFSDFELELISLRKKKPSLDGS